MVQGPLDQLVWRSRSTLFSLLTIDVEAILGLLLLLVWVQNTRVQAVGWWASAHLMRAASVMLYGLYGSVPDLISIDLANVILFSSFGVTWNGARVFNGRPGRPGSLIAGASIWLVASQWPGFEAGSEFRGQLSSLIIACYSGSRLMSSGAGARSRWCRAGRRSCCSRTHGAMFLLRSSYNSVFHGRETDALLGSAWLNVLSLEAFLMTIATAFILLAMSKERTELRHKTAAMIDSLTRSAQPPGVHAGRRSADEAADQPRPPDCGAAGRPRSLQIGQRSLWPCGTGDKVLQVFAKTARANLRQTDVIGRLGGEEFVVVLADAAVDNAYLVADRLRKAFAANAAVTDGIVMHATASIGVSVIVDPRAGPHAPDHACRSGALSRQGARPQPRGGRADRR